MKVKSYLVDITLNMEEKHALAACRATWTLINFIPRIPRSRTQRLHDE